MYGVWSLKFGKVSTAKQSFDRQIPWLPKALLDLNFAVWTYGLSFLFGSEEHLPCNKQVVQRLAACHREKDVIGRREIDNWDVDVSPNVFAGTRPYGLHFTGDTKAQCMMPVFGHKIGSFFLPQRLDCFLKCFLIWRMFKPWVSLRWLFLSFPGVSKAVFDWFRKPMLRSHFFERVGRLEHERLVTEEQQVTDEAAKAWTKPFGSTAIDRFWSG